jgi:hypothetical protein
VTARIQKKQRAARVKSECDNTDDSDDSDGNDVSKFFSAASLFPLKARQQEKERQKQQVQ